MVRRVTFLVLLAFTAGWIFPENGGADPRPRPGQDKTQLSKKKGIKPEQSFKKITDILEETIDMRELQQPMKLKECLGLLADQINKKGHDFPFRVDLEAFKDDNPDAEDVREADLQFPFFPKHMKFGTVLRQALSQVRTRNATYLIRKGHIEITTHGEANPERLLRLPIQGRFEKRPLAEVLEELSEDTGAAVILDGRVGVKGRTPVSATFRNAITLEAAVRILAEMADLQAVTQDDVLFVTSKTKGEKPIKKTELHFKDRRLDLALKELSAWTETTIVLDPIFEKTFPPAPFGGRPRFVVEDPIQKTLNPGKLTKYKVTASFKGNVSAEAATRILANMVDLTVVRLDNALFVTTLQNANQLRAVLTEPGPRGQNK